MNFHKTCKTLPIYNFNEILLNKDLRFLIKDFDEYDNEDLVLSSKEICVLQDAYKKIIYEYSELTSNNSVISRYKSEFKISELIFIYENSIKLIEMYSEYKDINLLKLLNKLSFNFNEENGINTELNRITKSIRALKTKIDILKLKHKEKFEKENHKTDSDVKYVNRLEHEAIALELSLKLNYSLNLKTLSTSKWVMMWNISNKKNS